MSSGRLLNFSYAGVFMYAYDCTGCGRTFRSSAPEESDPIMCHSCYNGLVAKSEDRRHGAAKRKKERGKK